MRRVTLSLALALATPACGTGTGSPPDAQAPLDATPEADAPVSETAPDTAPPLPYVASMNFAASAGAGSFYAAPFPSEHLRRADGSIDLSRFPNPQSVPYAATLISLAQSDSDGFGLTSAVYMQLGGAPDPSVLPDYTRSIAADSPAFVISVDNTAADLGRRYPVEVTYQENAGPFGAPRLLAIRPMQGAPLRPHTLYAAVVRTSLRSASGAMLGADASLGAIREGRRPEGLSEAAFALYRRALEELTRAGVSPDSIAGLAVFRTGDPGAGLYRAYEGLRGANPLRVEGAPTLIETQSAFCVYRTTVRVPVYQRGTSPYDSGGGEWAAGPSGALTSQREEVARLFLTVPRNTVMPAEGYPLVVFVRTGGGGDRPLIDRGVRVSNGGPVREMGSGPAREFAAEGFAGAEIDGPLGGMRNPTGGDEQLLVFNFNNLVAMRDNLRQSALELALLPSVLASLRIDVSGCMGARTPDNGPARFDPTRFALMGHSMGATIAPLALALAPEYRAAILSGAGGSWTENVIHKRKPVPVRPLADLLVRYAGTGRTLREDDPILNVLQWGGEPADPPVYARSLGPEPRAGQSPRHVLVLQGIVDRYILPPIANALYVPMGLDQGGTALDSTTMETAMFMPLARALAFSGRGPVTLPARDNAGVTGGARATGVVLQFAEDGIEDGHEVAFQREDTKRVYRCYLRTFAAGLSMSPPRGPVVNDPASATCPM